jgi:hypothetical protein
MNRPFRLFTNRHVRIWNASSEEEEFADASDEMGFPEDGEAESGNGRRH